MRRTYGAIAAALVLSLSACGSDKAASADGSSANNPGTVTTSDGVEIAVPEDWAARPDKQQGNVVLVAEGSDKVDQLLVSKFDTTNAAQDQALYTVTGLTAKGMDCKPAKLEGRSLFDCPADYQGKAYRRLFFPLAGDDASYLVLVQISASSLDEAAKVASPMIDSIDLD